jgi:hypothetical protein
MADDTKQLTRAERLAVLRAQVEAAEAQAQATAEEAEERALIDRLETAQLAVRRGAMMRMVDHHRAIAEQDGSYIVAPFDCEADTPGAGLYVLRSPAKPVWKDFQAAVAEAGGDSEKVDRAYNNLAGKCILWSDPPAESWDAQRAKYAVLVQAIGDAAGRLGGAADRARKR